MSVIDTFDGDLLEKTDIGVQSHNLWTDEIWSRFQVLLDTNNFDAHHGLKVALVSVYSQIEKISGFRGEIVNNPDMLHKVDHVINSIMSEAAGNINKMTGFSAFEMSTYINFYNRTLDSLSQIIGMYSEFEGNGGISNLDSDPQTTMEEWERMQSESVSIANSPIAHFVRQQGWIATVMWQQRGQSLSARKEWLLSFYDHVVHHVDIYSAKRGKELYTGATPLEIERDVNGIASLGIRDVEEVFLHGPGDAQRVDGPVMTKLREMGVIASDAHIDGLDLMAIENVYPGINLVQGDLLTLPKELEAWLGKKELLFEAGSPRANVPELVMQFMYLQNLARLAKDGAYLVTDYAVLEPLRESNRRVVQTKKMVSQGHVVGDAPIQPAYLRVGEPSDTVGSRQEPLIEYLALAGLAGWECVNLPKRGTTEWWDLMSNIQNKEWLIGHTDSDRNSLTMPFYYAGEGADGSMVRATLMFKKIVPDSSADVISALQKAFWDEQGR